VEVLQRPIIGRFYFSAWFWRSVIGKEMGACLGLGVLQWHLPSDTLKRDTLRCVTIDLLFSCLCYAITCSLRPPRNRDCP